MSDIYFQRLQKLQKEFKNFATQKKRFNKLQKIMFDFVKGYTKDAIFEFEHINVILKKGDEKKGFKHILLRHYCSGCDGEITAKDILNFGLICKKSIRLSNIGVSNKELVVLQNTLTNHKIVLKQIDDKNLVVTLYSLR